MAKVFKATIFFVDANGSYENKERLIDDIDRRLECTGLHLHAEEVQESEEFEWSDELDINFTDAESFHYDEYLK